jgi:hypothetical protein
MHTHHHGLYLSMYSRRLLFVCLISCGNRYWWQFVILLRRSSLVGVTVVFYSDRLAKLAWYILLTFPCFKLIVISKQSNNVATIG